MDDTSTLTAFMRNAETRTLIFNSPEAEKSPPPSLLFSATLPHVAALLCLQLIAEAVPRSKLARRRRPHIGCANTGRSVNRGRPRSYQHMPPRREAAAPPRRKNGGQLTRLNESRLRLSQQTRPAPTQRPGSVNITGRR